MKKCLIINGVTTIFFDRFEVVDNEILFFVNDQMIFLIDKDYFYLALSCDNRNKYNYYNFILVEKEI